MTDSCCPRFKQIQATIVRYGGNKNKNSNVNTSPSDCPAACAQAETETNEFEHRVCRLKSKLDEANANIALLRSWVGETDEEIKEAKPRGPKEMVEDLKCLIVKLDEYQHQADVISDRGQEAMNMLDEIENQACYCALSSESCENIKKQLADIAEEKQNLEDILDQMQKVKRKGSSLPPQETINAVKKELSEVMACTDWTCPKLKDAGPKPQSFIETGIQSCCAPCKRPKLSQTDASPKWNQGTSPSPNNESRCCKSLNTLQ